LISVATNPMIESTRPQIARFLRETARRPILARIIPTMVTGYPIKGTNQAMRLTRPKIKPASA